MAPSHDMKAEIGPVGPVGPQCRTMYKAQKSSDPEPFHNGPCQEGLNRNSVVRMWYHFCKRRTNSEILWSCTLLRLHLKGPMAYIHVMPLLPPQGSCIIAPNCDLASLPLEMISYNFFHLKKVSTSQTNQTMWGLRFSWRWLWRMVSSGI
jgi:hypothetical protein